LVEQLAFNQLVVGSNPTRPTISKIWKAHENADFQIFFCLSERQWGASKAASRGDAIGNWA
jgi:hypothetical protein